MKEPSYAIAIIFCGSARNADGTFDEVKDGRYLGSQIRMDAAVAFAPHAETLVLVGGDKEKVDGMKEYLAERGALAHARALRIESGSDTLANLRAVRKAFADAGKEALLARQPVALLSNAYHLPRIMRLAGALWEGNGANLRPVAAEDVLQMSLPDSGEYRSRLACETQGLEDWTQGRYRNQHMPYQEWRSVCHDPDLLASLTGKAAS